MGGYQFSLTRRRRFVSRGFRYMRFMMGHDEWRFGRLLWFSLKFLSRFDITMGVVMGIVYLKKTEFSEQCIPSPVLLTCSNYHCLSPLITSSMILTMNLPLSRNCHHRISSIEPRIPNVYIMNHHHHPHSSKPNNSHLPKTQTY